MALTVDTAVPAPPSTHNAGEWGARIADPGPLGLAAFAMTTFFLSSVNAGWLPKSVEGVVLGLALFYGGIAQVFAGMWEFVKGNTFGAVAFTSYGAFWLSFWYLIAHTPLDATADDKARGIGFYLLGWTIFTAYMLVCTLRINGVLIGVFGFLTVTFLALTLGELTGVATITTLGGYLGLITAALAWYGSLAGVRNSLAGATLPTFPRS
ncbi:MAG: acetate uptake transporter [Nakamurella sp.]